MSETTKRWWKDAVFYQIYPKSFKDTDGDGIGNIRGIIEKLDYFSYLGVNALWICPVYQSPMKDNGYDISDYYKIQPEFGTIEDMKELVRLAKARNIHIIMDLVVNHCSDQHPWFQDVKNNPDSPYREYFLIREGDGENPPNNWRSIFGGSVWEKLWDNQYYYHTFAKEQPDLNWECSEMRQEIYKMMRYWLDLGIDGFRIDAITFIKKDPELRSMEPDGCDGLTGLGEVSENYPGIEVFLEEMKRETYGKYDAFSVAEISRVSDEMLKKMIGENGVFDSIFDFSYLDLDVEDGIWCHTREIEVPEIKEKMFHAQNKAQDFGGYLSVVLENHDQNRSIDKFLKNPDAGFAGASMLASWNLMLRGVPFIYQGEEIGMTNKKWKSLDEIDDISTYGQYETARNEGIEEKEAFEIVAYRSRDNARTPMQWDDAENAGFSQGKPWLAVNDNYKKINVRKQKDDAQSLLEYYRRLIGFRRSEEYGDVLSQGTISRVEYGIDHVIAFKRETKEKELLVILNYSSEETKLPAGALSGYEKVMGNYEQVCSRKLRPYEAVVLAKCSLEIQ